MVGVSLRRRFGEAVEVRCGAVAGLTLAANFAFLLHAGLAHAFSAPGVFAKAASAGGSEGRFFTGSPADGYNCDVCHSGGKSFPLYVTGVPVKGYTPGKPYELRFSWPEYTAREAQLLAQIASIPPDPTRPALQPPTMSMVTELVAETGKGSGKLVIKELEMYTPGERCQRPPGKAGQSMWIVRAKAKPLGDILLECTSKEFNDRCLVAQIDCGAAELRMTWTAPPEWQGTIWLSAALVTSEALDSKPTNDGVYQLNVPIPPAASLSAGYVEKLDASNCSVGAANPPSSQLWAAGVVFAPSLLFWARRRRRRAQQREEGL